MPTECPIKLVNDHIIIDNEQHLLIDTGSPVSFHTSGAINLCGENIPVSTSIPGVRPDYLSSNVGTSIDGLVGMDIIHRYTLLIDVPRKHIIINDDAVYPNALEPYELGALAGGLIAIKMMVNNQQVQMIVDTGAPISYINDSIVAGMESESEMRDFHPFIGDFHTNTYRCEANLMIGEQPYNQLFGVLPKMLEMALSMIQVNGIIGIELFKHHRIQIKDGKLFLPPQGI